MSVKKKGSWLIVAALLLASVFSAIVNIARKPARRLGIKYDTPIALFALPYPILASQRVSNVPPFHLLPLIALSGLLFLASVSCGAVLPLGSAASGTSTSPSPTPVVTPAQTGFTTYSNTFDHYSVTYPVDWFILPSFGQGGAVSISNKPFDGNKMYPGAWKLDIVLAANPKSLTAGQWADKDKTEHSQTVLSETSITLAGQVGIQRHISQGGFTAFGFWVVHDGHMLLIDATDQPDFQPVVAKIVASMVFTA